MPKKNKKKNKQSKNFGKQLCQYLPWIIALLQLVWGIIEHFLKK